MRTLVIEAPSFPSFGQALAYFAPCQWRFLAAAFAMLNREAQG